MAAFASDGEGFVHEILNVVDYVGPKVSLAYYFLRCVWYVCRPIYVLWRMPVVWVACCLLGCVCPVLRCLCERGMCPAGRRTDAGCCARFLQSMRLKSFCIHEIVFYLVVVLRTGLASSSKKNYYNRGDVRTLYIMWFSHWKFYSLKGVPFSFFYRKNVFTFVFELLIYKEFETN